MCVCVCVCVEYNIDIFKHAPTFTSHVDVMYYYIPSVVELISVLNPGASLCCVASCFSHA